MTLAAAFAISAAVLMARSGRARLRLSHLTVRQGKLTRPAAARRARLVLVGAVITVVLVFGLVAAVSVGAIVGMALVMRRVAAGSERPDEADVALAMDLLGAALASGAVPAVALGAIAPGVSGAAGPALAEAATALSLGLDPGVVWARVGRAVPALDQAAATIARAAASGAAVAEELFRLAAAARAESQARRRRRLERAGVWLVLPLGLCFLPAFVLVAVVPVVLSAAPALAR